MYSIPFLTPRNKSNFYFLVLEIKIVRNAKSGELLNKYFENTIWFDNCAGNFETKSKLL